MPDLIEEIKKASPQKYKRIMLEKKITILSLPLSLLGAYLINLNILKSDLGFFITGWIFLFLETKITDWLLFKRHGIIKSPEEEKVINKYLFKEMTSKEWRKGNYLNQISIIAFIAGLAIFLAFINQIFNVMTIYEMALFSCSPLIIPLVIAYKRADSDVVS